MERKIAIVESDPISREAIELLITTLGYQAEVYSTTEEGCRRFDAATHACMVVGADGDGERELELLLALLEQRSAARIVLLTDGSPTSFVVRAMRAGLSTVLEHPFTYKELTDSVVMAVTENVRELQAEYKRLPAEISELLTRQEEDIAMLLIEGAATKEIAARLDLSVRTIHYRKNGIFQKIGAKNRNQAIKLLTRRNSLSHSGG